MTTSLVWVPVGTAVASSFSPVVYKFEHLWNLCLSNCEHYFFFFMLPLKTCFQRAFQNIFYTQGLDMQVLILHVERSAVHCLNIRSKH